MTHIQKHHIEDWQPCGPVGGGARTVVGHLCLSMMQATSPYAFIDRMSHIHMFMLSERN